MRWALTMLLTVSLVPPILAQEGDIPWQSRRIDDGGMESFRCLRGDTMGRIFVGGETAVFVYEPNERNGYRPRQVLYRFPKGSPINDIEIRGHDLYVLTATALYLLPDAVRKRDNLKPRKVLWGVPGTGVMRSMAWGPQGDLYIAISNPAEAGRLAYWTFFGAPSPPARLPEKIPYRGAGAVIRCKPDGTSVQVVARGLQSPGGMAFDRHWNLFLIEGGRLQHVMPRVDLGDGLPAVHEDLAAALGTWDERLLAARDHMVSLTPKERGASFQASERALFVCKNPRAISVDGDDRILAISASGELLRFSSGDSTKVPYDLVGATTAKLWQELDDSSWHRRNRAHLEFLRRGGDSFKEANKRLLTAKVSDPATRHFIWLAAQNKQQSLHLIALIDDPDSRIRAQVLRALTDYPEQMRGDQLIAKFIADSHPHVQHAAIEAYFSPKLLWLRPIYLAVEWEAANNKDSFVQRTAARLLAEKLTRKELEVLCIHRNAKHRLAGVRAVGYRLTESGLNQPLAPHLPLGKFREATAYLIEHADGKVDLREHGRVGTFTIAEHWNADKQTADQHLLLKLLRQMAKDDDVAVRLEAVRFLAMIEK